MLRALGLAGKSRHALANVPRAAAAAAAAWFGTSSPSALKAMPPRPKPPAEEEIEENFIHGSGPGGQKINKTASAVQLKHLPTGIVVKSQATRSREQNRKIARELLAARLDELANGDRSRTAIVGSVKKKRADSAAKKARRKYRRLEEERTAAAVQAEEPGDRRKGQTASGGEAEAEAVGEQKP